MATRARRALARLSARALGDASRARAERRAERGDGEDVDAIGRAGIR